MKHVVKVRMADMVAAEDDVYKGRGPGGGSLDGSYITLSLFMALYLEREPSSRWSSADTTPDIANWASQKVTLSGCFDNEVLV